jgi:hypothetical protein
VRLLTIIFPNAKPLVLMDKQLNYGMTFPLPPGGGWRLFRGAGFGKRGLAGACAPCSGNKNCEKKRVYSNRYVEGRKEIPLTGQQFEISFEIDLSSSSDAE